MAESFINQVKRTSSIKTYEYEDFLIKGEVKNAKNMITKAIQAQKSHVTWCYDYDDYDSYTSLWNDIDNSHPMTRNYKTDNRHTAAFNWSGSMENTIANILADGDSMKRLNPPKVPQHVDFKYIEKILKKNFTTLAANPSAYILARKQEKRHLQRYL